MPIEVFNPVLDLWLITVVVGFYPCLLLIKYLESEDKK